MVSRFRFRLDVVLKLRRQALDSQRRVVADAIRAVGRTEQQIVELTRQRAVDVDDARGVQKKKSIDIVSMRRHQLYRGYLQRRFFDAYSELDQQQAGLRAERQKLAEESKRLKVIETLRDKQWKRHLMEARREEQATSDETALQIFVRRQSHQACGGLEA